MQDYEDYDDFGGTLNEDEWQHYENGYMDFMEEEDFEALTEEEQKEEMIRVSIPEAKTAAYEYMEHFLGEIEYIEYSHPYNLERWYRRRDLRFNPFFAGYLEGTVAEHYWFNETEKCTSEYTKEEVSRFAEIYSNGKVPDNNNKRNITWKAYYDGYIWGYYKDNLNEPYLPSLNEAPF